MVVEVAQQAGWDAIAVSGIDGYQVWFSLSEPVPVAQALDFLESLRVHYLGAIAPRHIGIKPADFRLAQNRLRPAGAPPVRDTGSAPADTTGGGDGRMVET